jgi:hypothetical protein
MGDAAPAFTSTPVDDRVRSVLVQRLAQDHADQPFAPDDPRAVVGRAARHLDALGLSGTPIRGTVSIRGVEVDHVWLAIGGDPAHGWVLDVSLPLLDAAFVAVLTRWVAGLTCDDELIGVAAPLGIDSRVLGIIPPSATYRGRPYWGARRN